MFGAGRLADLTAELERLEVRRALLIGTPGRAAELQRMAEHPETRAVSVWTGAVPHISDTVAAEVRALAEAVEADSVVCLGGGSAIGAGKVLGVSLSLPIVAIPSTYSGSEMTPIWGMTKGGVKTTSRSVSAQPRVVIYDPELTLSLSPATSAASGMNAIAHCVEALYSPDVAPLVSLASEEGVRILGASLPRIARLPDDLDHRTVALLGAYLGGLSLAGAEMGLHHKVCHALGGALDLPHAETHAVLLPHTLRYNQDYARDAAGRIARALGCANAADGIAELLQRLPLPKSLGELGVSRTDLDRIPDLVLSKDFSNPAPLTRGAVEAVLQGAFDG